MLVKDFLDGEEKNENVLILNQNNRVIGKGSNLGLFAQCKVKDICVDGDKVKIVVYENN